MQPIHTQKSQKRLQPSQPATVYGAVQQKSVWESGTENELWSSFNVDLMQSSTNTLPPSPPHRVTLIVVTTTNTRSVRPFHMHQQTQTQMSLLSMAGRLIAPETLTDLQSFNKTEKNNLVSWTWSIKLGMSSLHVAKTYSSISKTHFTLPVLSHSGS